MSYQFTSTTSLSDETYLESFVESTSSSLPSEIRRNLEHLRSLDSSFVALMEKWRDAQDGCISAVEDALYDAFRRRDVDVDDDVDDDDGGGGGGGGTMAYPPPLPVVRRRGRPPKRRSPPPNDAADDDENDDDANDDESHRRDDGGTDGIGESPTKTNDDPPPVVRWRGRPPKDGSKLRATGHTGVRVDETAIGEEGGPVNKVARLLDDDEDGIGLGVGGDDDDGRERPDGDAKTEGKDERDEGGSSSSRGEISISPTTSSKGGGRHITPIPPPTPTPPPPPPPTRDAIERALASRYVEYRDVRRDINDIHVEVRRLCDEKIDTSRQLRNLVDMALGRLDRDLARFEVELGIDAPTHPSPPPLPAPTPAVNVVVGAGGGSMGGGGGVLGNNRPGGTAAVSSMAGASTGVAGDVGMPGGGCSTSTVNIGHRRAAAGVVPGGRTTGVGGGAHPSATNVASAHASAAHPSVAPAHLAGRLSPPHGASLSEGQQQQQQQHHHTTRGVVPPPPRAVRTDNLAAIQVSSDPNSDWILAKVLSHDKSAKVYTLKDEDLVSNQIYRIPERRTITLRGTERSRWSRGDAVFAVYPDTTSFYPATVSTPPFNGFVMVKFANDEDDDGVTHEKAVLMAHVMKVPPGAK